MRKANCCFALLLLLFTVSCSSATVAVQTPVPTTTASSLGSWENPIPFGDSYTFPAEVRFGTYANELIVKYSVTVQVIKLYKQNGEPAIKLKITYNGALNKDEILQAIKDKILVVGKDYEDFELGIIQGTEKFPTSYYLNYKVVTADNATYEEKNPWGGDGVFGDIYVNTSTTGDVCIIDKNAKPVLISLKGKDQTTTPYWFSIVSAEPTGTPAATK